MWGMRATLALCVSLPSAALPYAAMAAEASGLRISSTFGARIDPIDGHHGVHTGVDLPAPMGTPVVAAADGVVRVAGRRGGYGNLVELAHADGSATRYAHLSAILVRPGEAVSRGQLIAQIGSTGRSTGAHLHFEYRVGGVAVNPLAYLGSASARTRRVTARPDGPPAAPEKTYQSRFAQDRAAGAAIGDAGLPGGDTVQRSLAR